MSEMTRIWKKVAVTIIVTIISYFTMYEVYKISEGPLGWIFPVVTATFTIVWAVVLEYDSDLLELIRSHRAHSQAEHQTIIEKVEALNTQLEGNKELRQFKGKLFHLFRGKGSSIFSKATPAIAFFKKTSGSRSKYSPIVDPILFKYGFKEFRRFMNIRVAPAITAEDLDKARGEIEVAVPALDDLFFVRIPSPAYFVPGKLHVQTRGALHPILVQGLSEREFDKFLVTNKMDVQEWIAKVPLVEFLSKRNRARATTLEDVYLRTILRHFRKGLDTGSQITLQEITQYIQTKGVVDQPSVVAAELHNALQALSEFITIVEGNAL